METVFNKETGMLEFDNDTLKRIEMVRVYEVPATDKKPLRIMCYAKVDKKFYKPRQVSTEQMQYVKDSGDCYMSKVMVAANIFVDVLEKAYEEEEKIAV